MITALVRPKFAQVYGGTRFEGKMQTPPRCEHGAWVCRIYVEGVAGATAKLVLFRLGHLESLTSQLDRGDHLAMARREGWDGRLVTDPREVVLWTARDRAQRMISQAVRQYGTKGYKPLPREPADKDWASLDNHLGAHPTDSERALFLEEFAAVIDGRSSQKDWGD